MAIALDTPLARELDTIAREAGVVLVEGERAAGFAGAPTERYTLMLPDDAASRDIGKMTAAQTPGHRATLEFSEHFSLAKPELARPVHAYLLELSMRLRNPRPEMYMTLGGMPVSFGQFSWPLHRSTSGADTYVVHGETKLEDGKTPADQQLRAKVSASMTVTFAEIVVAPEQPFAESFILNAVRKTMDQGQLELTKSGNRQVVMVTTRFYSVKQGRFVFNDTDEQQLQDFLAAKVFWQSGVLGGGAPVWIADPCDAQYLNTTVETLKKTAEALAGEGVLRVDKDFQFAASTEPLMTHHADYESRLAEALAFTRPTFNEEMRAGHTNM